MSPFEEPGLSAVSSEFGCCDESCYVPVNRAVGASHDKRTKVLPYGYFRVYSGGRSWDGCHEPIYVTWEGGTGR